MLDNLYNIYKKYYINYQSKLLLYISINASYFLSYDQILYIIYTYTIR